MTLIVSYAPVFSGPETHRTGQDFQRDGGVAAQPARQNQMRAVHAAAARVVTPVPPLRYVVPYPPDDRPHTAILMLDVMLITILLYCDAISAPQTAATWHTVGLSCWQGSHRAEVALWAYGANVYGWDRRERSRPAWTATHAHARLSNTLADTTCSKDSAQHFASEISFTSRDTMGDAARCPNGVDTLGRSGVSRLGCLWSLGPPRNAAWCVGPYTGAW